MTFDQAITLIREGKHLALKIEDADNRRILDLKGTSAEDLISKLEMYRDLLSSYGRIKILAATEAIERQNWKGAYSWIVTFSTTPQTAAGIGAHPAGFPPSHYVSANEAMLMAKLEGLQRQVEFDKRFAELTKKLEGGNTIDKFLPFLPLLVDMPADKINNMMAMAQMQGLQNGTIQPPTGVAGMAGLQEKKSEVQTTVQEKNMIDGINDEMGKLSEKVDLSVILETIKKLNEKAEVRDMFFQMAKNF